MPTTFDVAALAAEETITVKLKDGELRSRDLTPDVVDTLAMLEDRRAREGAHDEGRKRGFLRTLENENASDDDVAKAEEELVKLVTEGGRRTRQLAYEQLAAVLVDDAGKKPSIGELQKQIPLPVARRISAKLTEQILGRTDAEGNAEASDGPPNPTGSTS